MKCDAFTALCFCILWLQPAFSNQEENDFSPSDHFRNSVLRIESPVPGGIYSRNADGLEVLWKLEPSCFCDKAVLRFMINGRDLFSLHEMFLGNVRVRLDTAALPHVCELTLLLTCRRKVATQETESACSIDKMAQIESDRSKEREICDHEDSHIQSEIQVETWFLVKDSTVACCLGYAGRDAVLLWHGAVRICVIEKGDFLIRQGRIYFTLAMRALFMLCAMFQQLRDGFESDWVAELLSGVWIAELWQACAA